MKTVFVLYHNHDSNEDTDNAKLLGIFSSKQNALDAIDRFRKKPGFSNYPNGFSIDEYQIDKEYWPEGFSTE